MYRYMYIPQHGVYGTRFCIPESAKDKNGNLDRCTFAVINALNKYSIWGNYDKEITIKGKKWFSWELPEENIDKAKKMLKAAGFIQVSYY